MNNYILKVIIVNYNTVRDTIECLESLLKQSHQNYNVYVVDNSETDESFNLLKDWAEGEYINKIKTNFPNFVFPLVSKPISYMAMTSIEFSNNINNIDSKVVFIRSYENKGFAAANNIVLESLKSQNEDYICWLLNNDTVVSACAMEEIINHVQNNYKNGIFGTSLMEYRCRTEIQSLCGLYYPKSSRLEILTNEESFTNFTGVKYPNGASMLVTKEYLNTVGSLSEDYFLYFEELDWILNGNKKGFTPSFLIKEIVYHKGGSSTGKNSELTDFYFIRGRLILTLKFFKKYAPFVFLITLIIFPFNRIMRGQIRRVPIVLKAIKEVYNWSKKKNSEENN